LRAYVIRRIIQSIPLIVGITIISFFIAQLAPGNPLRLMINPSSTPQEIAEAEARLGLDKPIIVQYFNWLKNVASGNLGYSIKNGRAVLGVILERLPATLLLTITSWILGFAVAIPLGVYSAVRKYSIADYALTVFTFFGISVPSFFFGLGLIYIFTVKLHWLPSHGLETVGRSITGLQYYVDRVEHLIMPAVVLSLANVARVMRYTRSSMLDVVQADYIRTARAKGLSERMVLYKHALKNALIPVVTLMGLTIPLLFGGAFITETVFSWPGMGKLGVDAIFARDYPVIMGINVFTAVLVLAGNLVADILYAVVNPEIRYA